MTAVNRLILSGLALLVLCGCTPSGGSTAPPAVLPSSMAPSVSLAPSPGQASRHATPPPASIRPVPAPLATAGHPQTAPDIPRVTGSVTGPCHLSGTPPYTLPDPRCTPGSYDPGLTAAVICAPDYDVEANRPPTTGKYGTTRAKYLVIWPAYGLPAADKGELDHLISRGLGGNNTEANLMPEPGKIPNPKDKVENALRRWVCTAEHAGNGAVAQGRLAGARQEIARDWITAEQVLGVSS